MIEKLADYSSTVWPNKLLLSAQHLTVPLFTANRQYVREGDTHFCSKRMGISSTLAEKVLFRQLGHVGTTQYRVNHSFAIRRRVGRRGFSARV